MSALRAFIITVSDRVSRGEAADQSGPLARDLLERNGFEVVGAAVVPDEIEQIRSQVAAAAAGADAVILTGGTGLGPRDVTPEALDGILAKQVPGVGEAIRAASRASVPTADLSRITAGTLGQAFVVALPGSRGGVWDGLNVAIPLIEHAVHVLRGGDHG